MDSNLTKYSGCMFDPRSWDLKPFKVCRSHDTLHVLKISKFTANETYLEIAAKEQIAMTFFIVEMYSSSY